MILSPPAPSQASAALRFDYETTRAESLLHRDDVLAVFGFGAACPLPADARVLRVGLEPVGAAPLEVWRTSGPVRHGCEGDLRWSEDGDHLFFALEVDEQAHAASRRRPTMPTGGNWGQMKIFASHQSLRRGHGSGKGSERVVFFDARSKTLSGTLLRRELRKSHGICRCTGIADASVLIAAHA